MPAKNTYITEIKDEKGYNQAKQRLGEKCSSLLDSKEAREMTLEDVFLGVIKHSPSFPSHTEKQTLISLTLKLQPAYWAGTTEGRDWRQDVGKSSWKTKKLLFCHTLFHTAQPQLRRLDVATGLSAVREPNGHLVLSSSFLRSFTELPAWGSYPVLCRVAGAGHAQTSEHETRAGAAEELNSYLVPFSCITSKIDLPILSSKVAKD